MEYVIEKGVNEQKDYSIDFTPELETDETIAVLEVTATSGITVDTYSESAGIVTIWLSGGTGGEEYIITCTGETSEGSPGRDYTKSIKVPVVTR